MKWLIYPLIFFLGISQTLTSQIPTASANDDLPLEVKSTTPKSSTQLYFLAKESFPLNEKGKQFLKNEFVEGTIIDFENETHLVPIRYRFFDDEMQIMHLDKVKALYPQRIKKIIFTLNGMERVFAPFDYFEKKSKNLGFFEVKSSGKISLLKSYRPGGKKGIKSQFFSKINGSPAVCFKNKKSNVLKIFGNDKSKVSKYIVKEKLNVKNEADLKKVFEFYNSLY